MLAEILRGGAEKAREAGIDIVGGHTIKTDEPIDGLAVTGIVDIDKKVTNAGGKAGDALILTKPIGLGIITTASKQDRDVAGAITEAIALMSALNAGAMEAMNAVGVHAATDVTGFGLLGHLACAPESVESMPRELRAQRTTCAAVIGRLSERETGHEPGTLRVVAAGARAICFAVDCHPPGTASRSSDLRCRPLSKIRPVERRILRIVEVTAAGYRARRRAFTTPTVSRVR